MPLQRPQPAHIHPFGQSIRLPVIPIAITLVDAIAPAIPDLEAAARWQIGDDKDIIDTIPIGAEGTGYKDLDARFNLHKYGVPTHTKSVHRHLKPIWLRLLNADNRLRRERITQPKSWKPGVFRVGKRRHPQGICHFNALAEQHIWPCISILWTFNENINGISRVFFAKLRCICGIEDILLTVLESCVRLCFLRVVQSDWRCPLIAQLGLVSAVMLSASPGHPVRSGPAFMLKVLGAGS